MLPFVKPQYITHENVEKISVILPQTQAMRNMIGLIMKTLLPLLFTLLIIGSCNHQPGNKSKEAETHSIKSKKITEVENENTFVSLDKWSLLNRLFDNPLFDKNGTAIWRPNYYERMAFPVSYDGRCHTSIDTIMYYADKNNKKCAAVILTTYNYRRSELDSTITIGDCHFCGVRIGVALFSANDSAHWELYKFEKQFTQLGYFGEYRTGRRDAGRISLKQIGDGWTCLSLTQGVGGNGGILTGTETLYSIERYDLGGFPNQVLSEILSYDTYDESYTHDGKPKTEQKAEMRILTKKNNYYDIDLVINKDGKLSTGHYKYSDEYSRYIEK